MKKILIGTIVTAAVLMATSFAPCAGCHGESAQKAALGKSQIIKGWPANKIIAALKGYKDGTYGSSMKGIMKGQVTRLSDKDITDLAHQISKF